VIFGPLFTAEVVLRKVNDPSSLRPHHINRFADKALHGHFVLTEFERDADGEETELSREVIER
jgi:hypothetical protein